MKLKLIIVMLAISYACRSQDYVELSSISINGYPINEIKKSNILTKFGHPLVVKEDFSEMDNKVMYIYNYKGAKFIFIDDNLKAFDINSSEYEINSEKIKVEDSIFILENIYPISFRNKTENHLVLGFEKNDKYLSFHYNKLSNKISLIRFGDF